MANIPIRDIPGAVVASPDPSNLIPMDNGSIMQKTTIANAVNTALPLASQATAEAGVNNSDRMSSLRTKQAIDAQTPTIVNTAITTLNLGSASQSQVGDFATAIQGAKADSAVQPGNAALVPSGGAIGQVLAKTSGTDYATAWTAAGVGDLLAANDLSDLSSIPQARANLSVGVMVDDRVALAALDTTKDKAAYLTETGREGQFIWREGDYSALVGADPLQGVYIEADAVAATAGAWVRQGWLTDGLDPCFFGADATGVADSAPAVAAAIALSDTISGHVHFGPGRYRFESRVEATLTRSLKISGSGRGVSNLVSDNTAGLFSITPSDQLDYFELCGLSMLAGTVGTGDALTFNGTVLPSSAFPSINLHNFDIQGDNFLTQSFLNGVVLDSAWNGEISSFVITGAKGSGNTRLMNACVTALRSIAIKLTNFTFYYAEYGYFCDDPLADDEGIIMSHGEMVDVDVGIHHKTPVAEAGSSFHDLHVNARKFCMDLNAKQQVTIHDNLLYHMNDDANNWVAVRIQNGDKTIFSNNQIVGGVNATGSENGVVINNSNFCLLQGNQASMFSLAGTMFIFQGTSSDNRINGNVALTDDATINLVAFTGTGTRNGGYGNRPQAEQTLANNSATPSVGNAVGDQWNASNASATTITNFINGSSGQTITIHATNGNTTIQHNAGMILKGAVNVTLSSGQLITLQRFSGAWRELSRSF